MENEFEMKWMPLHSIDVVKSDGRWFALYGWNGEEYNDCWEVDEDKNPIDDEVYSVQPIYEGVGEPDEDGYYGDYEIVDYKVYHEPQRRRQK